MFIPASASVGLKQQRENVQCTGYDELRWRKFLIIPRRLYTPLLFVFLVLHAYPFCLSFSTYLYRVCFRAGELIFASLNHERRATGTRVQTRIMHACGRAASCGARALFEHDVLRFLPYGTYVLALLKN